MLGNQTAVLTMLRQWDRIDSTLAMKVIFRRFPAIFIIILFFVLLFGASYCIRVTESPVNQFHSTWYWNHLWLVIVTMTTVGYGDNVPGTHFGRFVCVLVMAFGTVIVSMMTASATEFLNLTEKEEKLFKESQIMTSKRRVTISCTRFMQYLFRTSHGYLQENWQLRARLRHDFWLALHEWKNSQNYVDPYNSTTLRDADPSLGDKLDAKALKMNPNASFRQRHLQLNASESGHTSLGVQHMDWGQKKREKEKLLALGSQDYMSRHQQRNGQDEWEEREQKGDTELALKEDKKFARRKRRSAEEDFLKDYEPLQDASAEHLVESRPETKSRDSQRFSSKFETVADYVTVERKQKENWQNLHRWQESVDCRVDRLMDLVEMLSMQVSSIQSDIALMQERDLEGRRERHRSRSRLMRERTSQETTGSSRSRSRSRLMRERTPQETTNGVLGSQRSNLASGEERMTKGELLIHPALPSDHTMLTSPTRRPRDREKET